MNHEWKTNDPDQESGPAPVGYDYGPLFWFVAGALGMLGVLGIIAIVGLNV